uniref:Non-histone chromosomal protein 6 n=1 Tax=Lepeophtheirus salmonis TaxID=72036 RepID=D3PJ82_LEPSM|nr:Non-histone chromosomal protein 6 [Lepeophtheirus salmonis]
MNLSRSGVVVDSEKIQMHQKSQCKHYMTFLLIHGLRTSYLYFVCEQRKIIRKMNPSFSFSKVSKLLGIEWKKMSEKDKHVFHVKSIHDKHRYDREMLDYTQKKVNGLHSALINERDKNLLNSVNL